jgi:acetyl-CoA acyltransferase
MAKKSQRNPRDAVIVAYARSPFTLAGKGALATVRADDLAAQVIKGLIKQVKIKPALIEDLKLGCAFPEGEQGFNLARLVVLLAGLPKGVAGVTVNRFCGSSMQAIHDAAGAISAGMGGVFLCAGVESMSRIPLGGFNPMPNPLLDNDIPGAYMGMGETAENVAKLYKLSRADQEIFAVESHRKAALARSQAALVAEIVPITRPDGVVVREDGCIRPETNTATLATLKPAFDAKGTVTAGTSSPLTDGASAVLVTSRAFADAHQLPILAVVRAFAVSGCAPETMGLGPIGASMKALERAGLRMAEIDVVESNEAFAAQAMAVARDLKLDAAKTNIHGGALALGHPLGATGARIVGKAASLLQLTNGRYALVTQCIGGGQGIATILERDA